MSLWRLMVHFLRLGATGFGGPMALIGLMQERLVEKEEAISAEEFSQGVALGQVLPGSITVGCASHIGYRLRGIRGAIVATGSIVGPAFVAMLILTPLYLRYGEVSQVHGFFRGMGAAVVAVIAAACLRLGQESLRDVVPVLIAVGALVGVLVQVQPILLILAAGVIGIVLLRPRRQEERA